MRFTQIASIVFGIFALYSAIWAVPNALWFPRNLVSDLMRFGFILVTIIFGVALLFPHRFIPALRKRAAQITPAPLKFMCALLMCVCLFVALLSGAVNIWIASLVVTGFLVAFVLPGFAFRGLIITNSEDISLRALGLLAGEQIRNGPKRERGLFLAVGALFFMGLVWFFFGKQTLPSPMWGAVAGWGAVIVGGGMTAIFGRPYVRALPDNTRRGALPGLALWGLVMLAMSIAGCRALLHDAIPTSAAFFFGETASQNTIVLQSNPDKRRKGCYGSVELRTASGDIELCNLSREFLESLTPGDTVEISGKATRFGQTIETLRLLEG
jgi:hypothetical protein